MEYIRGTNIEIHRADTFKTRLLGLMFRKKPLVNEALLLEPCKGIHTYFMKMNLDIIVIDEGGEIIALFEDMKPGKASPIIHNARCFIECHTSTIQLWGLKIGHKIQIELQ